MWEGEGQNQKLGTNTSLTEIEKTRPKSLCRERGREEGRGSEREIYTVCSHIIRQYISTYEFINMKI